MGEAVRRAHKGAGDWVHDPPKKISTLSSLELSHKSSAVFSHMLFRTKGKREITLQLLRSAIKLA